MSIQLGSGHHTLQTFDNITKIIIKSGLIHCVFSPYLMELFPLGIRMNNLFHHILSMIYIHINSNEEVLWLKFCLRVE